MLGKIGSIQSDGLHFCDLGHQVGSGISKLPDKVLFHAIDSFVNSVDFLANLFDLFADLLNIAPNHVTGGYTKAPIAAVATGPENSLASS